LQKLTLLITYVATQHRAKTKLHDKQSARFLGRVSVPFATCCIVTMVSAFVRDLLCT